jgi:hypothetical protein
MHVIKHYCQRGNHLRSLLLEEANLILIVEIKSGKNLFYMRQLFDFSIFIFLVLKFRINPILVLPILKVLVPRILEREQICHSSYGAGSILSLLNMRLVQF